MDDRFLEEIAADSGTPVYVYYEDRIIRNYRVFRDAFAGRYPKTKILYAYKANTSLALCALLKKEGAGADTVSGGEIETALKIGLAGKDIIYSSNSKTVEELRLAVDSGVTVNVDSLEELEQLELVAAKRKKTTSISFRINPGIDPKTHPKIATGLKSSKFGLHIVGGSALEAYRRAKEMKHLEIAGIHTHIGSQITDASPFVEAADKLMEFAALLKKELEMRLDYVDLGGGLGIPYHNEKAVTPDELAQAVVSVVTEWTKSLGYEPELWLEPGRYIVANAGLLLSRVQTVKTTPCKKIINLDAGFNTLIRPAMYDAYHRITVVGKTGETASEKYDVAGSVCESGDIFAKDRELPKTEAGDLIVIHDAGAYGYAMASRYNSRPMPPEVLIRKNGTYENIRERETMKDLYRGQKIPKDLL